jgi:hypothetical protein
VDTRILGFGHLAFPFGGLDRIDQFAGITAGTAE